MLQIFRNKAQSSFAIIIVAVIILVFVFWGVGTNLLNDNQSALTVNDQEISFNDFQRAYNVANERISKQFGGNLPKNMHELVKNQVINQLIRDALVRQGAEEMGIIVSDEEVREHIETMPQFQQDGAFSLAEYRKILAANNLTPIQFEERVKKDHLLQLTINRIGDFAARPAKFEIEDIYSQINEKVSVEFVVFTPEDYQNKVTVKEKDLAAWFESNKDNYKTEPQFNFRYITFLFKDIAEKINIDPAKIEKYYQDHLENYSIPEQRKAAHILIKTSKNDSKEQLAEKRAKAEEIRQLAEKKEQDFAALAKDYSEGPSADSGGDLGSFARGEMVPAFDEAVFSMQPGEISEIVETSYGYHIIYLKEILPPEEKSFAEVRDQISSTLRDKEAESIAFQLANNTYEEIITSGSLNKFAKDHPDANFQLTGFITRTKAPADIAEDAKFLQQSFALGDKELSSLVKGDSGYAIFYAEEVKAPETPDLADIKQQVEEDYRKSQAKLLAQEAAESFLAQVKKGETDFTAAAAKAGVEPQNSGLMGHNSSTDDTSFPPTLIESCFQLSMATPIADQVGIAKDNFYVYQLLEHEIPPMPKDSPERSYYLANLQNIKQQQVSNSWLQHLWTKAKIQKHESL